MKGLHHILYGCIRTHTPELGRSHFTVTPFDDALIPQNLAIDAVLVTKAINSIRGVPELEKQLAESDSVKRDDYQQQLKRMNR